MDDQIFNIVMYIVAILGLAGIVMYGVLQILVVVSIWMLDGDSVRRYFGGD